jgi:hypothetical protein
VRVHPGTNCIEGPQVLRPVLNVSGYIEIALTETLPLLFLLLLFGA